ncbi:hypothetical protein PHMEG_00030898 [Phytophthora megakarya]|uniref:Uncharacterized protein n=1 Tax=Phytophthora megakarya TaxID=4795 RepID=A0A225V0L5_9STRA|nr:hypothetical protein PHMEG_00030898 [Phytophthora megakarya]
MAGKMTLPYSAYAHWNMICELQSVEIIHIWHLCNEDNSVGVVFQKNKASQNGAGSKDHRYLHANPLSPSLCCITALGYAELVAHGMGPVHVLQALSGATAFGRVLVVHWVNKTANKTMERNLLEKMCRRMHAMEAPVARRLSACGRFLDEAQDKDFRYKTTKDLILGRVLAGLLGNSASFAVLASHFMDNSSGIVRNGVTL